MKFLMILMICFNALGISSNCQSLFGEIPSDKSKKLIIRTKPPIICHNEFRERRINDRLLELKEFQIKAKEVPKIVKKKIVKERAKGFLKGSMLSIIVGFVGGLITGIALKR